MGQDLLRLVCAEPDSDQAKLIYANYMEDVGEPERAQCIRAGIEAEKRTHPCPAYMHSCYEFDRVCRCIGSPGGTEWELARENPQWFDLMGIRPCAVGDFNCIYWGFASGIIRKGFPW